jgi:hypothetical protein
MTLFADTALSLRDELDQSSSAAAAPANSGVLGFRSSDLGHEKILAHIFMLRYS